MRPLTAMPQSREPLRLSDNDSGGLCWRGLLPLGSLASVLLHGTAVALIASWSMREPVEAPIGYAAVELVVYSAPVGGASPGNRAPIAHSTSENPNAAPLPEVQEMQKVSAVHPQISSAAMPLPELATRKSHEPLPPKTKAKETMAATTSNMAEQETVAALTHSLPPMPRKHPVKPRVTPDFSATEAQELPRKSFGDESAASTDVRPGQQTASRAYGKAAEFGGETGEGFGSGDSTAVPVSGNPLPSYPYSARLRGLEGRVLLEVEVSEDGRAGHVRIVESSGHRQLDHSAREGMRRWQFRPASVNGRAVTSTIQVPVRFELTER